MNATTVDKLPDDSVALLQLIVHELRDLNRGVSMLLQGEYLNSLEAELEDVRQSLDELSNHLDERKRLAG